MHLLRGAFLNTEFESGADRGVGSRAGAVAFAKAARAAAAAPPGRRRQRRAARRRARKAIADAAAALDDADDPLAAALRGGAFGGGPWGLARPPLTMQGCLRRFTAARPRGELPRGTPSITREPKPTRPPFRGLSTSRPRRRRDPSEDYPRRGRGVVATRPRNIRAARGLAIAVRLPERPRAGQMNAERRRHLERDFLADDACDHVAHEAAIRADER